MCLFARRHQAKTTMQLPLAHGGRVWEIRELVEVVCEALSEQPATLAALALTSRLISDIALNVLWSRLRSTTPLWLTLGHDVWDSELGQLVRYIVFHLGSIIV